MGRIPGSSLDSTGTDETADLLLNQVILYMGELILEAGVLTPHPRT
jgi:hypothetical protein